MLDHQTPIKPTGGDDTAAHIRHASALLARGSADTAEPIFRRVLEVAPEHFEALFGLARCAQLHHDHEQAIGWFERALHRRPDHLDAALQHLAALRALKRFDAAQTIGRSLLARHSGKGAARWRLEHALGELAADGGDDATALRHFAAAADSNPRHVASFVQQGLALERLGRPDEAAAAFGRVLERDIAHPEAQWGMGRIARSRGDHEAALAWFDSALAAAPEQVTSRLGRAAELRALRRDAEARQEYERVLRRQPEQPQAALALAEMMLAAGDPEAALPLLKVAARTGGQQRVARLKLASAYAALQQFEPACAVLDALLAEGPKDAQALLALGRITRTRGDRDAARGYFEQAAEAAPDDPGCLIEQAAGQREIGAYDAAAATLERLLSRHPMRADALFSLGVTERERGRHEAALQRFAEARAVRPNDPRPLLEMAAEERTLGRLNRFVELTREAVRLAPDNPQVVRQAADHALLIDDPHTALDLLRRGMAANPHAWVLDLRICHVLTVLGRFDEALTALDGLAQRFGDRLEVQVRRIELRQQLGHWRDALDLAREQAAAAPWHFELWSLRARLENLLSEAAQVRDCLGLAPVRTVRERVTLLARTGALETREWRLSEAVAAFEAAAALDPRNASMQFGIVRAAMLDLDLDKAVASLQAASRIAGPLKQLKGQSTSASQTFYGQMLDEFRLDAAVLARLRKIMVRPAVERLDDLMQTVRERPDSTVAAIMLIASCRQAGLFARREAAQAGALIAGPIVQFWDAAQVPDDVQALMRSWRDHNPDREYRLFDDAAARAFLGEHYQPEVLLAYRRVREPAQKADLFRLAFLASEGGIYVDADDRCVAPVDTLLGGASLVAYQEDLGSIANNVLAVVPEHPVIVRALDEAVRAVNRGDRDIVWLATGPGLLTRAMAQTLAASRLGAAHWFRRIRVLDLRQVAAAVSPHCTAAYKHGARHWHNSSFGQRTAAAMPAFGPEAAPEAAPGAAPEPMPMPAAAESG